MTTLRMTPTLSLGGPPSVTPVVLNGGIRRIDLSWDAAMPVIPNRCLSVPRPVCPRSLFLWGERDLPPPRALGMCGSNPPLATAVMGRFDRRRRRRECANASPQTQNVHLGSHRFIDAQLGDTEAALALRREELSMLSALGAEHSDDAETARREIARILSALPRST